MKIKSSSYAFVAVVGFSLTFASCNSTTAAPLPASPNTFLVPGASANYNGSQSVEVTFSTPSATTPNSSVTYTTTEADTVQAAPAGSPAPIDLHRVTTYITTAPPQYGNNVATSTTDQYENITAANGAFNVVLAQTVTSQTGTNISDADTLPSGAPYTFNSTTTTTYTSPTILEILPLTTGAQWNSSLSRTIHAISNTTNASGVAYGASNLTTIYQSDDSYSESGQNGLTSSTVRSEESNGNALITNTNTTTGKVSLEETISLPVKSGSVTTIPISVTTPSTIAAEPAATQAADWYPGGALPPSPLGMVTYNVVGPAPVLPAGCTYTGSLPNVTEYDSATSTVDVIAGTVTSGTSRVFDSNGLAVCRMSVSTVKTYTLTTGVLDHTTVTTTVSSLNNS